MKHITQFSFNIMWDDEDGGLTVEALETTILSTYEGIDILGSDEISLDEQKEYKKLIENESE